jgi:hypothetical protein
MEPTRVALALFRCSCATERTLKKELDCESAGLHLKMTFAMQRHGPRERHFASKALINVSVEEDVVAFWCPLDSLETEGTPFHVMMIAQRMRMFAIFRHDQENRA